MFPRGYLCILREPCMWKLHSYLTPTRLVHMEQGASKINLLRIREKSEIQNTCMTNSLKWAVMSDITEMEVCFFKSPLNSCNSTKDSLLIMQEQLRDPTHQITGRWANWVSKRGGKGKVWRRGQWSQDITAAPGKGRSKAAGSLPVVHSPACGISIQDGCENSG